MSNAPTGGDDFYAPRAPVFNPGNNRPFDVPRTEAVPRRVGRNPLTKLLTWAVVLTVGAIGAKYGYPVVMEKVHAKEIQAVSADLLDVGAAQANYFTFNGTYGHDFDALSIPKTVNQVSVVGVTGSGYCLRGKSATGGVVLYYTPGSGVSDKACG
jgi:hypothetical protein